MTKAASGWPKGALAPIIAGNIVTRPIPSLRPYVHNARTHSKRQIAQIAESIRRFGFTNPVLMSADGEIVAGHGRVEAAKLLGMTEVPTLVLEHLSAADRRAYVLADNKLALNAGWRHMRELLAAGYAVFSELKNLCVWNKTNGGMGAFYRSKHELVFVWKVGNAPHTNTFGLGDTGRYRTNVWDYAGISSISASRQDELEMHPTVKPVAMVADAIKDCSRRGEILLDGFGGSGSTLIAAEKTGRTARLIEYDPGYCDTILRRYQAYTGKQPVLLVSGEESIDPADNTPLTFEDVAEQRGVRLPERPLEPALELARPSVRRAVRGTVAGANPPCARSCSFHAMPRARRSVVRGGGGHLCTRSHSAFSWAWLMCCRAESCA